MDPRQLDDETLAAMADANQAGMGSWKWREEQTRRAEIRCERGEYGEMHDASWYDSRQSEAQWLGEIGADVAPFWPER
jgi:hypothetical protein